MDERRPGYYAVIPAEVRYDDRLKPNAKLLYGEISALLNQEGYCFASNAYFERLYQMTERTVRRLISQLQGYGYITVLLERASDGTVSCRKIRLAVSAPEGHPEDKNVPTPGQEGPEGEDKNVRYNNLSNTGSSNNTGDSPEKPDGPPAESTKKKRGQVKRLTPGEVRDSFVSLIAPISADSTSKNELFQAIVRYAESKTERGNPIQTQTGISTLFNRLRRLSGGNIPVMLDMLEIATLKKWDTVYPPKGAASSPAPAAEEERRWL